MRRPLRRHEDPKDIDQEVRDAIKALTAPMTITFSPANYRNMEQPFSPRVHVLFFCDYGSVQGENCLDVMHNAAPPYRGRYAPLFTLRLSHLIVYIFLRLLFVHVPTSEALVYQTFGMNSAESPLQVPTRYSNIYLYSLKLSMHVFPTRPCR